MFEDQQDGAPPETPVALTKWGPAVSSGVNGYQTVPDVLIRNQRRLGLDSTDLAVLLNITMHWWEIEPEKLPHPRAATIAKRIGISTRSVERHIARLDRLDLIKWMPTESRRNAPSIRRFGLNGLMKKLAALAAEAEAKKANAA